MTAAALLERLDKVQRRGADQWSARCPAHDDRGPSLSIKELSDGAVLVHCFAGCAVTEVLGAVGLAMDSLFPPRPAGDYTVTKTRKPRLLTASQALEVLGFESLICALVASDAAHGKAISDTDKERALQACGRIQHIVQEVQS